MVAMFKLIAIDWCTLESQGITSKQKPFNYVVIALLSFIYTDIFSIHSPSVRQDHDSVIEIEFNNVNRKAMGSLTSASTCIDSFQLIKQLAKSHSINSQYCWHPVLLYIMHFLTPLIINQWRYLLLIIDENGSINYLCEYMI